MIQIALLLAAAVPEPGEWRYVVPPAAEAIASAPFRALPLSEVRPEDVLESATYRGQRRRYAQVRFGSPTSTRVTVVLDEVRPGEADVYVDADRNRRIEARDRLTLKDRTARLTLQRRFNEDDAGTSDPREVAFRLGASGRTLAFAHLGFMEGRLTLESAARRARRMDGDGNGLFADAEDLVAIDRDGDGLIDPSAETFLFAPILALGESRFAVRGDLRGERLAMTPLAETGKVRLDLAGLNTRVEPLAVRVTLVGRDGLAVGIAGVAPDVTLPAGDYRVVRASITLPDPDGGRAWSFEFAAGRQTGPAVWHTVASGRPLALDPFRRLDWTVLVAPEREGNELTITPSLRTADGLNAIVGYRGTPAAPVLSVATRARVLLSDAAGNVLAEAASGFA
jgi:hypothetical protein